MKITHVTISNHQLEFDFNKKTEPVQVALPDKGKLLIYSSGRNMGIYYLRVIWPNGQKYEYSFDNEYFWRKAKNAIYSIKQFKERIEGIPYRKVTMEA
jgi:hypothetical protein